MHLCTESESETESVCIDTGEMGAPVLAGNSRSAVFCATVHLGELSFFLGRGGRLFVMASRKFYLVPRPWHMGKNSGASLTLKKFWSPLWPTEKTGPPFNLTTPKKWWSPNKQMAPLPVKNDSSLVRVLERGSVSSVKIKYFTVPDVNLKNTVSSVDFVITLSFKLHSQFHILSWITSLGSWVSG